MANSNGIITAPVSLVDDVASVLGSGSTDLGTLCLWSSINPYSKCKPIRTSGLTELTDDLKKSVDWGYQIPSTDMTALLIYNAIVNNTIPPSISAPSNAVALKGFWYYLMPIGGDSSPFRLTDFINYKHNVPKSILDVDCPTAFDTNVTDTVSHMFSVYSLLPSYLITLSDLNNLAIKAYRFGVLVTKVGSTKFTCVGCDSTISSLTSFTLAGSKVKNLFVDGAGDYYIIPMLFSYSCSSTPASIDHSAINIGITLPCTRIIASVTNTGGGTIVDYGFTISNGELVGRIISFTFGYNSNFAGKTANYTIYQQDGSNTPKELASGTIATTSGTTSKDVTVTISMPTITDSTVFYVKVYYNTTSVTGNIAY